MIAPATHELLSMKSTLDFSRGKHYDQIDAVRMAVQMMTIRKRGAWSFWYLDDTNWLCYLKLLFGRFLL
jgi:hypothetical protein